MHIIFSFTFYASNKYAHICISLLMYTDGRMKLDESMLFFSVHLERHVFQKTFLLEIRTFEHGSFLFLKYLRDELF